jgi:hypothetical protein
MSIVLAEIWLCLIVAAILGVATGWLLWGRPNQRLQAVYQRRLAKLRANWEMVEEQLAKSNARVAELENALRDRGERDSASNAPVTIPHETEEPRNDDPGVLVATVRALEERIRSLEAGGLVHETLTEGSRRRGGGGSFARGAGPTENAHTLRRRMSQRKDSPPVK